MSLLFDQRKIDHFPSNFCVCVLQRRRKEWEDLWIEFSCEEKEELEERKKEEQKKLDQAQRDHLRRTAVEQLQELERRKMKLEEESQFERLLVIEQSFH